MLDSKACEHILRDLDDTCHRIQVLGRGVRMAVHENDTELACRLLDLIQSEFEGGPVVFQRELDEFRTSNDHPAAGE